MRSWIPHLRCCANQESLIVGLSCLPLRSRAVICRFLRHFPLFYSTSWTKRPALKVPLEEEILKLLIIEFLIIIRNQYLWTTMASKLHLELNNNSLCCLLADLNYFKEIGPVIPRIRSGAIFCQGQDGSALGWSSSWSCSGWYVWQIVNERPILWCQHSCVAKTIFQGQGEYIPRCRCDCCGAAITFPYEVKRALRAVLH